MGAAAPARLRGRVGAGAIETRNFDAVHLPQPARRRRQAEARDQLIAVALHGRGIVAAAQAEIERVERRL
jgi:hypothetical protein